MDYQYKVIVSNRNVYKEFEIPADMERVRLGTTSSCEFRLNPDAFFDSIEMEFEKKNSQWEIASTDTAYISRGDMRKLLSTELKHGDILSVRYTSSGNEAFEIRFMIDFEAKVPDYNWFVDISSTAQFRIGCDSRCDLVVQRQFDSDTSVLVKKNGNEVVLIEEKSKFGILVNGKRIQTQETLNNHEFVFVENFIFYYKNDCIYFDLNDIQSSTLPINELQGAGSFDYPLFIRNTRVKEKIDETAIKVLDPASKPTKPELNLVMNLMPTLAMFAMTVVMRGMMSDSQGSYVLFSICSMGLGVVTSILGIFNTQKKYKDEIKNREQVYLQYVENKRTEISEARQEELDILRRTYIDTNQCIKNVLDFNPQLFDRTSDDEDFLDVYLGSGKRLAKKKVDYKEQEALECGDELSQLPVELCEQFKYIENAPIVLNMKDANAVGVVGTDEKLYQMFKNILLDVVSRQYFGDVKIYALLDEEYDQYQWMRLLPNIQNTDSVRNIVCDNESKNNIFEYLYKELTFRSENKGTYAYNVIFIMNEHGIKSHPISKFIEKASELNTVFVFFENKEEYLPLYCSNIIKMEDVSDTGLLYSREDRVQSQQFVCANIYEETMSAVVKKLAPVYCEEISLESSLRKSITLFELLGIYSVEDIDLNRRWNASRIYDTMAVPLGVNVKDDIVYLNLHEKFHGPHGLVAGTTGSGKSEILQSYILSAATLFHPYEIGFVIIDFKGGGMVNQFKNLPHLIGAITNIDGKEIDRSLKSIKAELLKRQTLFANAGVNHIDKYIKAYKEGRVSVALPHLVIIVDEFAELKAEQPEFMKELISAARIGRSLGVHLILATQKPAGQVNEQIWSNSKFKLCLKVQDQSDSNEVLKSPLAAEIREPGRAYLQVGNNEIFELFQSGFSGAPEKLDDNKMKAITIKSLDFKGTRKVVFNQKPAKNSSARNQLEAIVDYVNKYCESNRIERLQEICLPSLKKEIVLDWNTYVYQKNNEMSCPIGIYDDPDSQYQGITAIDVATQNTMIIGSAQYGKTNLLQTIIRNLAEAYSPNELNMYIIDFGSMVLKNFEKLNHVGGVVCPADDEKLKNLFKFLNDQMVMRREKMLSVGVSSFVSYKEAGYNDLPQIVVLVDNLTMLRELYLQDNDVLLALCRESLSVGISFVIANTQTTGMGYKYLANFAGRIALFCNETSEYSNLFGPCKLRPDETPGRSIVEINKGLYECQTYLAFEGEKEIDRVREMQKFVETMNDRYADEVAMNIPEIPEVMTEDFIIGNYGHLTRRQNKLVLGMSYDTVSPVACELAKANMLSLIGQEGAGKSNFVKYVVHALHKCEQAVNLYVYDNYKKQLATFVKEDAGTNYNLSNESLTESLIKIEAILKQRYEALIKDEEYDKTWQILIINNEDAYDAISNDRDAMQALKNIINKYKMLNALVLFNNIPNAPIAYGAPEVYKLIKDTKNIMFFDDLENCKVVDVPLAIIRNNKKKIELGDAYFLCGNDCYKVKTPLAIAQNQI